MIKVYTGVDDCDSDILVFRGFGIPCLRCIYLCQVPLFRKIGVVRSRRKGYHSPKPVRLSPADKTSFIKRICDCERIGSCRQQNRVEIHIFIDLNNFKPKKFESFLLLFSACVLRENNVHCAVEDYRSVVCVICEDRPCSNSVFGKNITYLKPIVAVKLVKVYFESSEILYIESHFRNHVGDLDAVELQTAQRVQINGVWNSDFVIFLQQILRFTVHMIIKSIVKPTVSFDKFTKYRLFLIRKKN